MSTRATIAYSLVPVKPLRHQDTCRGIPLPLPGLDVDNSRVIDPGDIKLPPHSTEDRVYYTFDWTVHVAIHCRERKVQL